MCPKAIPTDRCCMPLNKWPTQDVDLWQRMTKPISFLSSIGVGSKWRKPTEIGRRRYYGRFLTYLSLQSPQTLALSPAERITPPCVKAYVRHLQSQGLKSITVQGYVIILLLVLRQEKQDAEAHWLHELIAKLEALASESTRKRPPMFSQSEMLIAACDYMENCRMKPSHLALDVHVRFRDGLMIALQSTRALRPLNLAMIDIGKHLVEVRNGYKLIFSADEIKTGKPYDYPFPEPLKPYLVSYLHEHRPALLQGGNSLGFWISNQGVKMTQGTMAIRFKVMTKRLIGQEVNPNAFRHGAATFVASDHPHILSSTPAVLHHATGMTAERYYTMANSVAAGRRYQDVLLEKRRRRI